ncbi:efflux RND transporter periplasmic adaptor subunit [Mesorhizobium sp. LHD-90]|uniref:efflux RND transporter periplasmic adaptor subunit n=1 Tax=Mesorhizobium sp. LHD-90 TaxID=3071414 RepID=UPI0027DFC94A|nr:efflux RND transporter periplasmic adaptor subunit [Mesorhizobium sp. LHD-90]MDQ6438089.1 efflux RND transporter periplasmic adaptor subunit [Mesorhizobium sp. LHD-90]
MTAEPTDFTQTVRLPGRVKASTLAEVRPQVSGIISERLFEEGAAVEKGAPLYKIEEETYAAAVAAARASVTQAEANLALAEREAERAGELFARGTGSEQRRDSATATRDSARAALQMARAQLQSAEIDLDRTTIRASISGVIGLSQSTAGSLVSAQQADALTTIRTLDPIYVDVTQSANELLDWDTDPENREMRMPSHANLILPNGQTFDQTGELRAAEPRVEPTTGMVTLRIAFPNPHFRLLPGLYVEVELPVAQAKDAVLLPKNVVMRDENGAANVWLVENGKVVVRPVEIMTGSGNNWVTTGSLAAGDQVITSGFQKVAPGAQIEIAAPETAGQAGAEAPENAKGN